MTKSARVFFLCGFLMQTVGSFYAEAASENIQDPKSKRLADWKDVTIELFSTRTNRIAQVRGKKSCYSGFSAFYNGDVPIPHSGMAVTITVTAFVTDSGKTWAGPGRDFYIETDSGIIGGENWSPVISWCHSLVSNRPGERLDLATVIRRFDQQAHEISLYDARNPHKSELITDLGSYFNNIFDVMLCGYQVRATEVTGKIVRLDFKNEKRHSTGTAWIDINTKRIMKAIEDGKHLKFRPEYLTREDEKKGKYVNQK